MIFRSVGRGLPFGNLAAGQPNAVTATPTLEGVLRRCAEVDRLPVVARTSPRVGQQLPPRRSGGDQPSVHRHARANQALGQPTHRSNDHSPGRRALRLLRGTFRDPHRQRGSAADVSDTDDSALIGGPPRTEVRGRLSDHWSQDQSPPQGRARSCAPLIGIARFQSYGESHEVFSDRSADFASTRQVICEFGAVGSELAREMRIGRRSLYLRR